MVRGAGVFLIVMGSVELVLSVLEKNPVGTLLMAAFVYILVPPVLLGRLPPWWFGQSAAEIRDFYQHPFRLGEREDPSPLISGLIAGLVVAGLIVFDILF